ncbi:MAG: hypothetical protein HRT69_02535 [Flavobacteriaceae bacterium]|nr:hypothetical protein [Flavobacteriaceae bacterium]
MKNILILCCLFITISMSSQVTQTVPLHSTNYSNGVYFKDLNNELSFLVGTWEGELNNKKYTFEFTLFAQVLRSYENDMYDYRDDLMGKFKVVDLTTNQVLYNNLNSTNYEQYKISELYIRQQKEIDFLFQDSENNCLNSAEFKLLKDDSNPNQIIYKDFEFNGFGIFYNDTYGCPNYQNQSDIPMFLPSQNLILTRL